MVKHTALTTVISDFCVGFKLECTTSFFLLWARIHDRTSHMAATDRIWTPVLSTHTFSVALSSDNNMSTSPFWRVNVVLPSQSLKHYPTDDITLDSRCLVCSVTVIAWAFTTGTGNIKTFDSLFITTRRLANLFIGKNKPEGFHALHHRT